MITRRSFLGQTLALSVLAQLPGLTFAAGSGDARLVLIILRGALDGLNAVPPYGDGEYARARREIAIDKPGTPKGALKLDGLFGLHPSLSFMHQRYSAGEAIALHAIASPYRDRSHFDAQNLLENGTPKPFGSPSGWLNRALSGLPARNKRSDTAVALAQNVPLVLRGEARVSSWAPSALPEVDMEFIDRLADLYSNDPLLSERLNEATAVDALADDNGMGGNTRRRGNDAQRLKLMAQTAGKFLSAPDGPRIATLEVGGWDTHAQQGADQGQLATRLRGLDELLATLHQSLGSAWSDTAVLVVTEFGRTVAINGSRGTDHGTGAAAFLVGGAVKGGRVIADWPGLGAQNRYQGRDLKPTLDLRSVCKGILDEHFKVPQQHLESVVFPDSGNAKALSGLIRA